VYDVHVSFSGQNDAIRLIPRMLLLSDLSAGLQRFYQQNVECMFGQWA